MKSASLLPALQTALFRPGMKIAIACSGGADSVALLRTLLHRRSELGIVLSVVHLNHGLRGEESDADAAFVEALAASFELPVHLRRIDTPAAAQNNHQGLEEAARSLRYAWFWELLGNRHADAIVTAHTLDDQAETVLHRILRGAWTEGLSGIFPVLKPDTENTTNPGNSFILRPFLATTRAAIEQYLGEIGQAWREDSTNRDTAYTRNSLRHELIPKLRQYNPAIQSQLANMANLARDEEAFWQTELGRLLPSILLPGKAVRGGGRATDTLYAADSLSIEIERLRALHPAVRRRVLRAAAEKLGASLDFDDTERLLVLTGLSAPAGPKTAPSGLKLQLEKGLRAERSPRELRLFRAEDETLSRGHENDSAIEYVLPIPGSLDAYAFGIHLEATLQRRPLASLPDAQLRGSRAGDRVVLRHSRSRLKISEARRRARLPVLANCPVLEWQGEIVWALGLSLESALTLDSALVLNVTPLPE